MVLLGGYFILLFIVALIWSKKNKFADARWLQWASLWTIPLAYIAGQAGWIVAEVGRQPWAIQDILPTGASVSKLATSSVQTTFFIFLFLFTVLLIAAGVDPRTAEADACRIEHIISDESFDRLKEAAEQEQN